MNRIVIAAGTLAAAPVAALAAANAVVLWSARGRVFADVERLPAREHGLVPGTSRLSDAGFVNLHFVARTQAAAQAHAAGAVRTVVVSGGAPEVAELREALIDLGVPAEAIVGDPSGLDTLATVRWATANGVDAVVLIGQGWHVPRAIFLARRLGLDAIAYAPPSQLSAWESLRRSIALRRLPVVRQREWLARAKAVALAATGRAR
jgi:SanA protein